ncbi:unnamed protein product, partial [Rotaria sp. Silwood1]
ILKDNNSKLVSDPVEKVTPLFERKNSLFEYIFNASTPLKFVYTPVHGIGQSHVERAFVAFKFQPFILVDEQKQSWLVIFPQSDPEEEKETLECAIAVANKNKADFIIPTDSDVD